MRRHRRPRHGDGTASLVADRAKGDYLCYWYTGTGDARLVEHARAASAEEAIAWGRDRTARVRIRTAEARTKPDTVSVIHPRSFETAPVSPGPASETRRSCFRHPIADPKHPGRAPRPSPADRRRPPNVRRSAVLRFEWNALRTGDDVLVHDPRSAEMTLTDGIVTGIDAHKGTNGVGIRVGGNSSATAVLWPSHLAVHGDPRDSTEPCWRCQELAERPAPPRDGSPNAETAGAHATQRPDAALVLAGAT